jgi:GNAT superfamily N-acetyltransferase
MTAGELERDFAAGVRFWGCEVDRVLVGVMGIQRLRDVDLVRHAYVHPSAQGRGVGHAILERLQAISGRQMLVGTWAAATWAIRFYERHGFELVPPRRASSLIATHWKIPSRQANSRSVGDRLQLRPLAIESGR